MENVQVNRAWETISPVCTHIGTSIFSEMSIRSVGIEKSSQVQPEDAWLDIYFIYVPLLDL